MCGKSVKLLLVLETLAYFSLPPLHETGLESRSMGGEPCCNRRIRHNPTTSNGSVRRYPLQASLVILPPLAIAAFVRSGSARSTPKTKRGIAALSSLVKRVVKDNNWNWQRNYSLLFLPHVPEQLDRTRPMPGVMIVGVRVDF
jgi:hypothetical protein